MCTRELYAEWDNKFSRIHCFSVAAFTICRSSSSVSSRIDAVISRMREISICVCPTDDANGYDMVMEWVFPVSRPPHSSNDVQMEMTNKEIE